MILVDTSIWIDFFRTPNSRFAQQLQLMLESHSALCINSIVRMEILQGVKKEADFQAVRGFLDPFVYHEGVEAESLDLAVEVYRRCRRQGVTIRKSADCIIAADALRFDLQIFHRDRDFTSIAKVFKDLSVLTLG